MVANRSFVNWFPQANLNYSFNSHSALYFNYTGTTIQPTLQQIQPFYTNDDPMNIVIGNTLLKPSFRHILNLNINDFKTLSGRSIFFGAVYTNIDRAITNRDYVDTLGRRVSQSINTNGNYSFYGYLGYGFKSFGANFDLTGNFNDALYYNFVNNHENITKSQSYSLRMVVGKTIVKRYTNSIAANIIYTTSRSSVQNKLLIHYWTYNIRPDFDFFLPWKFQIHTDCDFILRQKTNAFDNNTNVVFLNAWISKKVLVNDAMIIKIAGNDILNQNIGFNRVVNSNYISQNTYSTIQRYYQISLLWFFNSTAIKK